LKRTTPVLLTATFQARVALKKSENERNRETFPVYG